jgi:hypothetical protein
VFITRRHGLRKVGEHCSRVIKCELKNFKFLKEPLRPYISQCLHFSLDRLTYLNCWGDRELEC